MKAHIEEQAIEIGNKYAHSAIELRSEWISRRQNPEDLRVYINSFISLVLLPLIKGAEVEEEEVVVRRHRATGNRGNPARPPNHRARVKHAYARCQELFKKCPKKLAEFTVRGDFSFAESRQALPCKDSIAHTYGGLWGQAGPEEVLLPNQGVEQGNLCASVQPITLKDVKGRISKTKSNSAAGVDGVKRAHIARAGVGELLALLYNILLLEGIYPDSWKVNRTTLIPKAGKDLTDVKNWRPITVGSLLARIYSALIDGKLRQLVKQSPRQKGFTREDGCRQNILILEQALDEMKSGKGGVTSVLDVSKAFDSVPHAVIRPALRRKGIPDHIITEIYTYCKTIIKGSDGDVAITLKRGVEQGDPLSPMIFNLAIEPLLEKLCLETRAISIGESSVPVLAFADDLVLLSTNREEGQKQLDLVQSYLEGLGVALAATKCQSSLIVAGRKTWYMDNPRLNVSGTPIPNVEAGEVVTYLGAKLSPRLNLSKGQEVSNLTQVVNNVKKLKLKPHQKLELLKTYILSRFVYRLTVNCPSIGVLSMLDSTIRQGFKRLSIYRCQLQLDSSTRL